MSIPKFKSKMGVITTSHDMKFDVKPGSQTPIIFTVSNSSNQPWPLSPNLINANTGETQSINKVLKPQESTQVVYLYNVPADVKDSVLMIRLNLVNPMTNEKFGDALTAVCVV